MLIKIWRNYSKYFFVSNRESRIAIFFGIVGAFLETLSIYLLANLISNFENKFSYFNIKFIGPFNLSNEIIIAVFFISGIFASYIYYISNKNIVRAKCKIERYIREEITDLTLNIKWEYYLKLSQGDISKSIISEGQNISEGYMYFLQAITNSVIAITYFCICLLVVPDTFFILILYGFLAFRIYVYYSKKAEIYGKDLSSITSKIGNWTASLFNNLKYIRTISKDKIARDESRKIFLHFGNAYSKAMVASYKSKFITELLTICFLFLAILYILISNSSKSNLILSLSLFVRMTPKVYNSQTRFLDSLAMISWPNLYTKKIKWAQNHHENNIIKKHKLDFNGTIILNSVSFNYPDCTSIIENLNLKINDKDSIGIIGKSGSGKSTLIDLITGIIKPTEGDIFVSGENTRNININEWRENIGIVMQENYFKNDSVAANIALGEKNYNKEKIKSSLIKANAWDFVEKLPNSIDEIIYDKGMRFSGGERKKLALARAFYSDPNMLILDEPSTGLDIKSESEFISVITSILGTMTVIIISHKKDLVNICDRTLHLKNKRLIAI